ncbi:copper homeostasis protein CutC [Arcanobacterium phocae]|uniref:copper homeostasis protein CutC n=1 Tax=Arcanobacterium phocae TaxID=131112 RepID=UPI001C0F3731|nr:copper homeostasis protein CutC [Arcanobacterium phocae]
MLEVIALNAHDALAAAQGGADRIELVGTMDQDGLSATLEQVRQIRAVSTIPIRAMVRDQAGFMPGSKETLAATARELVQAGVEALVVGWVRDGQLDTKTLQEVLADVPGCELTIHRAIDNVADYAAGWHQILSLSHVTSVLTAGSAAGVTAGMDNLLSQAVNPQVRELMMVGGGLHLEHLPALKDAGIHKFHVGSAVRGGSFANPIDPLLVESWAVATGVL